MYMLPYSMYTSVVGGKILQCFERSCIYFIKNSILNSISMNHYITQITQIN